MELETWKPVEELAKLRERIEQVAGGQGAWQVAADWFETDDDLIVVLDAPGANPNAFEITHNGETLAVAGERAALQYGEQRTQERSQGRFERSLTIPAPVESGSAVAQYRAGLLELRFRKLGRTITVEKG